MSGTAGLFIFLTAVFGVLFLAYFAQAGTRRKRIEALTTEVEDLKNKLDRARDELSSLKEEFSQARPELNDLRVKYKAAKKDLFEADDKIKAALSRAEEAERAESRAQSDASRLRDETAAARMEVEKAQKAAAALKDENRRSVEKIRELELRPPRIVEPDNSAAEKAQQQTAALQYRLARLEKKMKTERDEAIERARTGERYRKRLESVQTAYEVLRGQYNALHDRLLHRMGMEGDAEDRDNLLKPEPEPGASPPSVEAAKQPPPGDGGQA